MYIWDTSRFGNNEFSHVFPRPLGGGIIIGGVKIDHDWDDKPDMARAERIKERACQLCPELGRPDQLQVLSHNVGLRRKIITSTSYRMWSFWKLIDIEF